MHIYIFFFLLSYLLGSISFSIIVSKAFGLKDPRSYGSNNPGATNIMRTGKVWLALLTFLGDFAKGYIVILIAEYIHCEPSFLLVSALFVVLGHILPIFFEFEGGKGVATSFGVLLALNVKIGLCIFIAWILIFSITKISSLASILSFIVAVVFTWLYFGHGITLLTVFIIMLIIFATHRSNLYRLIFNMESRIGE